MATILAIDLGKFKSVASVERRKVSGMLCRKPPSASSEDHDVVVRHLRSMVRCCAK